MNPLTATDTAGLSGHPSSANLLRSLTPLKIEEELPEKFISALAHEIRNPLSTINLAGEMLKSMTSTEEQKTFLDIILRGSVRINDILTELFTSLKPDEIQEKKYSIHELLDEVLGMAKDRTRLKNIAVKKEYAAKDYKIILNRSAMKIALTNIMINAIEAMNTENGELRVVTKSTTGKYVIEIKDNGCGISKTNLKKIFTPYFTNKPGGLGLGLSTTYNILKSNHIGVNVKSEEGKGTRFILLLDKNIAALNFGQ